MCTIQALLLEVFGDKNQVQYGKMGCLDLVGIYIPSPVVRDLVACRPLKSYRWLSTYTKSAMSIKRLFRIHEEAHRTRLQRLDSTSTMYTSHLSALDSKGYTYASITQSKTFSGQSISSQVQYPARTCQSPVQSPIPASYYRLKGYIRFSWVMRSTAHYLNIPSVFFKTAHEDRTFPHCLPDRFPIKPRRTAFSPLDVKLHLHVRME
ncbi:hypothetical protein BJ508DRAFT_121179 [Ascobolus immersus RN42]|uniref:Uncharacterized protein n=1 Tax=Ascobolus immersus RN42 TaxID=1160509 RepID=A0A3N4IQ51_ASCIM|nr:hypothetical protein BJ508DRAFT_121179 [Ascobolus immersus RN42]